MTPADGYACCLGRAWDEDLAAIVEHAGAEVLADLSPSYTMRFKSPDELWQVMIAHMTPMKVQIVVVRGAVWHGEGSREK